MSEKIDKLLSTPKNALVKNERHFEESILDSTDESSAFLLPPLETQEFSVYLREEWLKFRLRYNHFLQDSCVDTLLFGVFLNVSM